MRRMRTIPQAAEWIKETDPCSALSQSALRRLVLTGVIPHVPVGNKRLIALEDIEAYLAGELATQQTIGGIRRVEVR